MKLVSKEVDDIFDSEDIAEFEWSEDRTDEKNYWSFVKNLVAFIDKIAEIDAISTTGDVDIDYTADEYHSFDSAEDFKKRNEEAKEDAQLMEISFTMDDTPLSISVDINGAKQGNAAIWGEFDTQELGDKFSDLLLKRFK